MPGCNKSGKRRNKSCNRSCATAQKVVIPKGMVNPDETTIIEIPCRLHKQPVVVAKRKDSQTGGEYEMEEEASFYSVNNPQESQPSFARENTNIMGVQAPCGKEDTNMNLSAAPQGDQCGHTLLNIPQPGSNMVEVEANRQLDETEEQERVQLQKDLEAFQMARRKLLERTTKLTSPVHSNEADNTNADTNYMSCPLPCPNASHRDTMIDPRFDHEEYAKQLYSML